MINKILTIIVVILLLCLLYVRFCPEAEAKTEYQSVVDQRDKLFKEGSACNKNFKKLSDDEKFECLRITDRVGQLNIQILRIEVANVQAMATGY